MLKLLMAAVAATGVLTIVPLGASAAPVSGLADVHAAPATSMVTNIDYYWHHRHYHHRHWSHHGWHYY